ncbi:MAG: Fic family protein [Caldilineaceae bacterium SB0664_bin_22]|nr:Fic family protein [Caldilineaceae bacterium SB0664_bin_22]
MEGALREYQDNVRVRWNLHTNAIEGSTLSFANTATLLLGAPETLPKWNTESNPRGDRDIAEMRGHNEAATNLLAYVDSGEPLTQAALCHWHRLLLPTHTDVGQWKREPNVIANPDGRPGRQLAPPSEVPNLMQEFFDDVNAWVAQVNHNPHNPELDVPMGLAVSHGRYIGVHPFPDGNGRTGRLIMSWMALRVGYPVPIIPVSERSLYIHAVEASMGNNPYPLRTLLAACLTHDGLRNCSRGRSLRWVCTQSGRGPASPAAITP